MRETGEKPAVVCVRTDNNKCVLQGVFYRSDGTRTLKGFKI
jgi:hypothetical protein